VGGNGGDYGCGGYRRPYKEDNKDIVNPQHYDDGGYGGDYGNYGYGNGGGYGHWGGMVTVVTMAVVDTTMEAMEVDMVATTP